MAWIYLAEGVEQHSLWDPISGRSPIARATSLRKESYLNANKKERSTLRLSGTTYEVSHHDSSASLWTRFMEDGPARRLALQALEQAWQASDPVSFTKSSGLLAISDLPSSSWRTPQISLLPDSNVFSWTSMRWGMMRGGQLFQPKKWEPRISERDFGCLPTPTASEYGSNQSPSHGAKVRPSLHALARWRRNPTPLASDGEHGGPSANNHGAPKLTALAIRISTPCARDGKDGLTPRPHGRHSPSVAVAQAGHHGYLNPALVEVIMGYRPGWTVSRLWGTHGCLRRAEKPSRD